MNAPKMIEMDFEEVQSFFESWGLYPSDEDTGDNNPAVIANGINSQCYNKMYSEAKNKWGKEFANFCSRMVDSVDDAFSLNANTWDEVEDSWVDFMKDK